MRWTGPGLWKGLAFLGLVLGMLVLTTGAAFYLARSGWIASAERVEGRVIDQDPRRLGFSPIIEYWPARANEPVRFSPSWSTNPPAYEVGDIVPVLFQPATPAEAVIDQHLGLWWPTYTLLGIGALFFVFGVVARVVAVVVARPLA